MIKNKCITYYKLMKMEKTKKSKKKKFWTIVGITAALVVGGVVLYKTCPCFRTKSKPEIEPEVKPSLPEPEVVDVYEESEMKNGQVPEINYKKKSYKDFKKFNKNSQQ